MHNVTPKVRLIARSKPDRDQIFVWLLEQGVSEARSNELTDGGALSNKTLGEIIVEMAGRRCYKSFEPGLNPNVTRIREDIGEYIENLLKVGHGSVLEHVSYSFAIENVSRVFTGEMNRHRAGCAISEGSMRYIRFENIPLWVPNSIIPNDQDSDEVKTKKYESQKVFEDAFAYAEVQYAKLIKIWGEELSDTSPFKNKKNITSMMRRIIPMGVATGGIWTLNLRALRHVFNMRCADSAEEEIQLVANQMLEIMQEEEPHFFGDFEPDEETGCMTPKWKKV